MTRYKKECVLSKVAQSHFEVMLAEVLYADIQVTFHKINTKNSRKDPKEYILVTLVWNSMSSYCGIFWTFQFLDLSWTLIQAATTHMQKQWPQSTVKIQSHSDMAL